MIGPIARRAPDSGRNNFQLYFFSDLKSNIQHGLNLLSETTGDPKAVATNFDELLSYTLLAQIRG